MPDTTAAPAPAMPLQEGDDITFSTGRKVYANCGIFGIAPDGSVSGGYDSGIDDSEWTPAERAELGMVVAARWQKYLETAIDAGQVFSPPLVNHYEQGQRDLLNLLLTPNKAAADAVANLMDRMPADNPHGKLSFETLVWITTIAAQLGIEPKEVAPEPEAQP